MVGIGLPAIAIVTEQNFEDYTAPAIDLVTEGQSGKAGTDVDILTWQNFQMCSGQGIEDFERLDLSRTAPLVAWLQSVLAPKAHHCPDI